MHSFCGSVRNPQTQRFIAATNMQAGGQGMLWTIRVPKTFPRQKQRA